MALTSWQPHALAVCEGDGGHFAQMPARLPILAAFLALLPLPAAAQSYSVVVEEWVEEVPASRYVSPQHEAVERNAIAAFGPFRVIDSRTAALVDVTDSRAPVQFAALLAAFPQVGVLEFVEAPGTHDDIANLAVGRMIRAHGISTSAPAGGSVRSGAVELFLAGTARIIDAESEFAVHGWLDDRGRGAEDYPVGAPEHRRYLDYYAEMGMAAEAARDFYAMTNSVPFEDALWLTGSEMRGWIGAQDAPATTLARLDFQPVLQ